jgi:hypothetical protein
MKLIRKHIKKLFPLMVLLLLGGLILTRVYTPEPQLSPEISVRSDDAINHIGATAEVCGPVANTSYRSDIDGDPTFLNFDQPYPNQTFTVLIWGENRTHWPQPPEDMYENHTICVTGIIKLHEGDPEIVVTHPGRIRINSDH